MRALAKPMARGGSTGRLHFPWLVCLYLLSLTVFIPIRPALAQDAGEIVSVLGTVEVRREGRWQPVGVGETLAVGEAARTAEGSRAAIQLANGSQLKLNANTQLELKRIAPREGLGPASTQPLQSILRVLGGEIWVRGNGEPLEIQTLPVVATIRGTEFNLAVGPSDFARLAVLDGLVEFRNPQGSVLVAANEQATAKLGEPPRKTVLLDPLDAVQWSLYYPGIVSYRDYPLASSTSPQRSDAPPSQAAVQALLDQGEASFDLGKRQEARQAFTRALQLDPRDPRAHTGLGWVHLEAGEMEAALGEFRQARPPTLMTLVGMANALYRLNRLAEADQVIAEAKRRFPHSPMPWTQAALNDLIRGRVAEAQQALDQALALDPRYALAHGLRSNIYLVQNRKERALAAAQQAVAANPSSPSAYLDLSLAKQAEFQLEDALRAARQAVALDPENPQALIQESRLLFGTGRTQEALRIARQARQRAPRDALVNSTWGFLQLARGRVNEANQAFQDAIAQDSTLGEPHLGLGLVLFRRNQTDAAVEALRKATLLEPKASLYNSYLGKAYYEVKQDRLARKQLTTAKQLDPRDPTPHFYDAIRRQSVNRPVEAVQNLQKSIELNDNRAVYRSRLLLDEDLAARAATLGRIYHEVGFGQLGLNEGWKSLTRNPADHSAHRLLADSYSTLRRHEIARASELLQSQLLQPINITPVQPQLAETNLGILAGAGPATPSLYEFNPLFVRDHPTLFVSGVVGNNDTVGDELILSGISNRFSYSFGQFHYETNGFRENNQLQHDIYNLFTQVAITSTFGLQAELRRRETEQGDLTLSFFGDFPDAERLKLHQDTARLGARYAPSPRSNVIVSLIHADREEQRSLSNITGDDEGYQTEAQYLFRDIDYNLVAGIGASRIDAKIDTQGFMIEHSNAYVYANIVLPKNLTWTIGFSYDAYNEQGTVDLDQFNPKLGLRWDITDNLHLRLAAFETLKRTLLVEQTIEPTQVAGFNQFYDDLNATKAKNYAIGLDTRFADGLYGGVQASHRDLDVLTAGFEGSRFEAEREQLFSAYLYWMPHPNWAIQNEYRLEKYETDRTNPFRVDTLSIPLVVRYFDPSGFFGQLGAIYVRQEVQDIDFSVMELPVVTDSDDFVLVNAAVGFRLPKRQGILSLEAWNLFDKEFRFQDMSFRTSHPEQPANSGFMPDRTIFARITLNF